MYDLDSEATTTTTQDTPSPTDSDKLFTNGHHDNNGVAGKYPYNIDSPILPPSSDLNASKNAEKF